jgi:hypothetical protein
MLEIPYPLEPGIIGMSALALQILVILSLICNSVCVGTKGRRDEHGFFQPGRCGAHASMPANQIADLVICHCPGRSVSVARRRS